MGLYEVLIGTVTGPAAGIEGMHRRSSPAAAAVDRLQRMAWTSINSPVLVLRPLATKKEILKKGNRAFFFFSGSFSFPLFSPK